MTGQVDPAVSASTKASTHGKRSDSNGRTRIARAAVILARLLGSAEPLSAEEAEEAVHAMKAVFETLPEGLPEDSDELAEQWNLQRDLYANLPDSISLEESVYKEWTTDSSHPLAGRKGLAWGDPAAHMIEVLNRFGMALNPENPSAPDHIAVLLEFLAFLLENRPLEEAAAFCKDHLDWLAELGTEASERGVQGVFQGLMLAAGQLTNRIIT